MLRQFRKKPLRTGLVLLEIVLGSLAVTVALSAYFGSVQFASQLADRFELNSGWREGEVFSSRPIFAESDIEPIISISPDVKNLAVFGRTTLSEEPLFQLGQEIYSFPDFAMVTPNYFEIAGFSPVHGSFFSEADRGKDVLVMSDDSALYLFGNANPVGNIINVITFGGSEGSATPFTVVGTFSEENIQTYKVQEVPFYSVPPVIFPSWSTSAGFYPLQESLVAQAIQGREKAARDQLLSAARQFYETRLQQEGVAEGNDFFVSEIGQTLSIYGESIDPMIVLFGMFGIVALIASNIGIFSVSLVDVLERTHELGIRRALGASKLRITTDLVKEAALISFLGSTVGVLLALALIPAMKSFVGDTLFTQTNLDWHISAGTIAVLISTTLSCLLNAVASLQVIKMTPVEALRSN
jgi:putative ABC transport system permease protein